jgi:hypothetical protein
MTALDILRVVDGLVSSREYQIVLLPEIHQARISFSRKAQNLRLILEIWQLSFGHFDRDDVLKLGLIAFEVG